MRKPEKALPKAVKQPGFGTQGARGFAFLKGKSARDGHRSTAIASDYLRAATLAGNDEAEAELLYEKHRRGVATPAENRHMARILAELYKTRGISVFRGSTG